MRSQTSGEAYGAAVGVVAVGGNLPGRFASVHEGLEAAIAALPSAGFDVLARSSWWRSSAWPDPDAPPFLNGVVLVSREGDPRDALRRLKVLEAEFGRAGGDLRNAPRPLDLDLIAWGDIVMVTPDLTLPHARARDRLFVLGPLAEIAPEWPWPGTGEPAVALAALATVGRDAEPLDPAEERPPAPAG